MSEGALNDVMHRVEELRAVGHEHAFGLATFEARVEKWPVGWGDDCGRGGATRTNIIGGGAPTSGP